MRILDHEPLILRLALLNIYRSHQHLITTIASYATVRSQVLLLVATAYQPFQIKTNRSCYALMTHALFDTFTCHSKAIT